MNVRMVTSAALALALAGALLFLAPPLRREEPPPPPEEFAQRVALEVSQPSLTVGFNETFTVRAPKLTSRTDKLLLEVPELGYKHDVTLAQLQKGVSVEFLAKKVGNHQVRIRAGDTVLGTAPITVAIAPVAGGGTNLEYYLMPGALEFHKGGAVTRTVFVTTKNKDNAPVPIPDNAWVTIRDRKTNKAWEKLRFLKDKEIAQSQAQVVELRPDTDYELVGYIEFDNLPEKPNTNMLPFSWGTQGPPLTLVTSPAEQWAFATIGTPAPITVSLTYGSNLFFPNQSMAISAAPPGNVEITPAPPLNSDPTKGYYLCQAKSSTGQDATIAFSLVYNPAMTASVLVHFQSVWWFFVIALLGGICGRAGWLITSLGWLKISPETAPAPAGQLSGSELAKRFGAELFVGLFGAFVLAAAYVFLGLDWIPAGPFAVHGIVAFVVGSIGGILGIGALKQWKPDLSIPGL